MTTKPKAKARSRVQTRVSKPPKIEVPTIEAAKYKKIIAGWGLTQELAGLFFGYSPRVGQSWALGEYPVPGAVAMLIELMVRSELTPADVAKTSDQKEIVAMAQARLATLEAAE
jgi:hypothetical protein